jgi:hypothetical protein
MSTLNNVFKKLEHTDKVAKVNLESQRVELALLDDVKNGYDKANQLYKSNTDLLNKYASTLEKAFQDTANEYQKALDKFNQLEKSSKELGIDLPQDIVKLKGLIDFGLKDSLQSKKNAVNILAI